MSEPEITTPDAADVNRATELMRALRPLATNEAVVTAVEKFADINDGATKGELCAIASWLLAYCLYGVPERDRIATMQAITNLALDMVEGGMKGEE